MNEGDRQTPKTVAEVEISHYTRYSFAKSHVHVLDKVLDFGCGVGYGSYILAQSAAERVLAIDHDTEAVQFAAKHFHHPKIEYRVSTLIMESREFNASVCFEVLEHVECPELVLSEIVRASKRGAVVILSTPNEEKLAFSKKRFPFHVKHFTPKEFEGLITDSGLKLERRYCQLSKKYYGIVPGWKGNYNLALCVKP